MRAFTSCLHTHTTYVYALPPFSARLSKHQALADSRGSDGSTSSELNQLAYLHWGHAVFAGLLGSEGITVSPRPANRLPHTPLHLLGFSPSLKGMNWICSEWCVIQWTRLGMDTVLCVLHFFSSPEPHEYMFFFIILILLCCCSLRSQAHLTLKAWAIPHSMRSSFSKPDVDIMSFTQTISKPF